MIANAVHAATSAGITVDQQLSIFITSRGICTTSAMPSHIYMREKQPRDYGEDRAADNPSADAELWPFVDKQAVWVYPVAEMNEVSQLLDRLQVGVSVFTVDLARQVYGTAIG